MPSNFSNINALVIDNNSSMRQIMVSMLRAMGMNNVIVANNESQCIKLIASEKVNLVICGWALPKLNALSILKKLRNSEATMRMPFVIVSTLLEQDLIKQAIAYGVSEYIVPPFNKQIFEQRISKAVQIPIQQSAKNIASKINAKRFTAKKNNADLSILIVDDVVDNIEIIKEVIKDKYRVKAALNAKNAMKICLSDSPPDLILLDIMMPEVDGLTLCKQLKKNPLTQNIVIIFLTALSETSDVVTGLSIGAVDYITKPIIPEILQARINVHSTLIFNQRAIQVQIDELLTQNSLNIQAQEALKLEFKSLLQLGHNALSEVDRIATSKRQLIQPITELKYTLGMTQHIIDKSVLLDQLEKDNYYAKKSTKELCSLLLPTMNMFDCVKTDKNIERFEDIPRNDYVTCDENLFITLFSCLYKNALEAAPRGSKVSVISENHGSFLLITVHNIAQVSESLMNPLIKHIERGATEAVTDVGIYLAFLAIKQLEGELYYHSSEHFGTLFYIKLPL